MQAAVVIILRHVEVAVHATRLLGVEIRNERVDE